MFFRYIIFKKKNYFSGISKVKDAIAFKRKRLLFVSTQFSIHVCRRQPVLGGLPARSISKNEHVSLRYNVLRFCSLFSNSYFIQSQINLKSIFVNQYSIFPFFQPFRTPPAGFPRLERF